MNDLLTEIDRQPIIALKTKITNQPDFEKKATIEIYDTVIENWIENF